MATASCFGEDETFAVTASDGSVLPVYGWRGPAGAPALLVAHANGFAAGSYAPWLALLARDLAVFAFDARGHGRSSWPEGALDEVFHVDRFADDLALVAEAVVARRGAGDLHFAGHSLGAAAALRLATRGKQLPWNAGLLFEPPVFPAAESPHFAEAMAQQAALVEVSARRRAEWESPEALARLLGTRGPFARFRADFLAAHCRASLRPLPQGGFTLACPPAVESCIFRQHRLADTWQRLPAASTGFHIVRGDPDAPDRGWVSAVLPAMVARMAGARLTTLGETGHMMIFEAPLTCRGLILDEIVVSA